MRVLFAIAHYGDKNRPYLERMLAAVRQMDHEVDVVVLSESPKQFPPDVEVRVGMPTRDPWSLPFAHRELFHEQREAYDLFVYSEDDTLLEQRHLDTFADLSSVLPPGYLPGFMRFEEHPGGGRSYCTIHSHYRWDPRSSFEQAGLTFAHFSNEHGACYALTRAQLRTAIDSGGFLVAPHAGRYDMAVSAATDPYSPCGYRKVFCVERIEDQLVHHLPNRYLGRLGVSETEFHAQLRTLCALSATSDTEELFRTEVTMAFPTWSKSCFPGGSDALSPLVGTRSARILSLGTVNGATEGALKDDGHEVVGIPVDPVMGATAGTRGITVLPPRLPSEQELVDLGEFDALLAIDVLGYFEQPAAVLRYLLPLLRPGARVVATAPDHFRYRLTNTVRGDRAKPSPRSWVQDGIHPTSRRRVREWIAEAGLEVVSVQRRGARRSEPVGERSLWSPLKGNTLMVIAAQPHQQARHARTKAVTA